VKGFHVASVHSMADLSLMLFSNTRLMGIEHAFSDVKLRCGMMGESRWFTRGSFWPRQMGGTYNLDRWGRPNGAPG
jgi:hypothetical protein